MSVISGPLRVGLHVCERCREKFRAMQSCTWRLCPNCEWPIDMLNARIEDDGADLELERHNTRLAAHRSENTKVTVSPKEM